MEAQTTTQNRRMVLKHGGAPLVGDSGLGVHLADDLRAQGNGLRARQTNGGPRAPEDPTPTPSVNLFLCVC